MIMRLPLDPVAVQEGLLEKLPKIPTLKERLQEIPQVGLPEHPPAIQVTGPGLHLAGSHTVIVPSHQSANRLGSR